MGGSIITNPAELRALYGSPAQESVAVRCVLSHLDRHHRAFIALSPFLVIASADVSGFPDISPRGDQPGFVKAPDDHTLIVPDRPGNKKLETLTNILENPNIALIFFVPGRDDSVRVTGKARISTDQTLLASSAVRGNNPRSVLVISVDQAWLHCGKALIRSRLWHPDAKVERDALPTLGTMLADQVAGVDAAQTDDRLEAANRSKLWGEFN